MSMNGSTDCVTGVSTKTHLAILRGSLWWLCCGNTIGLLIASLLAWPWIGQYFGSLTYGRWVALHLNFQLYGWCSFPLLGMLYVYYLPKQIWDSFAPRLMLWLWSVCLAIGGFWMLLGHSSGKIFLEWEGFTVKLFLVMLVLLWIFLGWFFFQFSFKSPSESGSRISRALKFGLLVVLLFVPIAFYIALSPEIFPPINTASSGATGSSLLISSLAVVLLFLLFADSFGVATSRTRSLRPLVYGVFVLHVACWSLINHGDSSNYDLDQKISLGSFAIWLIVLRYYFSCFHWPRAALLWLRSLFFWSVMLVPTAILMFLPGALEVSKFSSFLVAHVHLAMAGVCTCFLIVVLCVLPHGEASQRVLGNRSVFFLWNISLSLHLVALVWLGSNEVQYSGIFVAYLPGDHFGYLLRVLSGTMMLAASLWWYLCSFAQKEV